MNKLFFIILILMNTAWAAQEIEQFTSDGCSRWPDGAINNPDSWKTCCFEHDVSYWMGGTEEEKEAADQQLSQCVGKRSVKTAGWIMYAGVKIGGSPSFDTPYRWGYGWKEARPYKKLTLKEREIVAHELSKSCFIGEESAIIEEQMKKKKLKDYFPHLRVWRK